MNSYQFQKHQTNDRIQSRLQEAEIHRLSKQGHDKVSLSFLFKLSVPLLMGVAVAVFILAG